MPRPLSQQQNESVPFAVVICKAKKAVQGPPGEGQGLGFMHNMVLLKSQWCAACPDLHYVGTVGQHQP